MVLNQVISNEAIVADYAVVTGWPLAAVSANPPVTFTNSNGRTGAVESRHFSAYGTAFHITAPTTPSSTLLT